MSSNTNGLQEPPSKLELDRDTSSFPQGSDPEEDPDLGSGESDGDWSQEDLEADIRRVKVGFPFFPPICVSLHILQVYELVGQKWTDRGTAFCQGEYDEEARQARLIARAEHNNDILLQCIIRATDVYQRQQGDSLCLFSSPMTFKSFPRFSR